MCRGTEKGGGQGVKALAVELSHGQWPDRVLRALASERVADPCSLPVTQMADSAAVRKGMPLFVPDFARGWELEVVPCFTIGRLGKTIPERFAGRYIESFGLVARLLPPESECPGGVLPALAAGFDGALCLGERFPAGESDGPMTIKVEGAGELTLSRRDLNIEPAVALLSRYMMLKTGDLIMPCRTALRVAAAEGTVVKAFIGNDIALNLKIK